MDIGDLTGPDYEIAQMAADGLTVRHIAPRVKLSEREAAARIRSIFAQLGVSNRRELRAKMIATDWRRTLERIQAFIETEGHSRVPEGYHDRHGRLDILIGNIRHHHAGLAGGSREPFPGIDYTAELERLPGWEW